MADLTEKFTNLVLNKHVLAFVAALGLVLLLIFQIIVNDGVDVAPKTRSKLAQYQPLVFQVTVVACLLLIGGCRNL